VEGRDIEQVHAAFPAVGDGLADLIEGARGGSQGREACRRDLREGGEHRASLWLAGSAS
jgi:hypothetical protein